MASTLLSSGQATTLIVTLASCVTSALAQGDGKIGQEPKGVDSAAPLVAKQKYRVQPETVLTGFRMSADGTSFATSDRGPTVTIWDAPSGRSKFLVHNASGIRASTFTPDGKFVVGDVSDLKAQDYRIKFWDLRNGQEIRSIQTNAKAPSILFVPGGNQIAMSAGPLVGVQFLELETGKLVKTVKPHDDAAEVAGFSPDGKLMVTASVAGNEIKITDRATGKNVHTISSPHPKLQHGVCLDPKGKLIASSGWDNNVKIWDLETGALKRTLEFPWNAVKIQWSPDGRFLAIRPSGIRSPVICDATTGKIIITFPKLEGLEVGHGYNSDGTLFHRATGRYIECWHIATNNDPKAKNKAQEGNRK